MSNKMKILLASDHAGVPYKSELKKFLEGSIGALVLDLGPTAENSTDYSQWALVLCRKMLELELDSGSGSGSESESRDSHPRGILICGSGIGMSMAANRFAGIRAALCRSVEDARLSREHNNANVLCLGARSTPIEVAKQIVSTWMNTEFAQGRHNQRIDIFNSLGEKIRP